MDTLVTARHALLIVMLRGPGFAFELADRVYEASKESINLKNGSLYPALTHLVKSKLVSTFEGRTTERNYPVTCYQLTEEGTAVAEQYRDILRSLATYKRAPADVFRAEGDVA